MIILDVTTQAKPGTMVGGSLVGMTGIWNIGLVGRICIKTQILKSLTFSTTELSANINYCLLYIH